MAACRMAHYDNFVRRPTKLGGHDPSTHRTAVATSLMRPGCFTAGESR